MTKHIWTIEYRAFLIHVNADGTAYTFFGEYKSVLAAKRAVTKYGAQYIGDC